MMRRIMVINDDAVSLHAMERDLTSAHYAVKGFRTGRDGLANATDWKPEIVIIDFQAGDVPALEVVRELRRSSDAACIMVTRYGHLAERARAARLGAVSCIEAPVSKDLLLTLVHDAVNGSRDRSKPDVRHALVRWAGPVRRALHSPNDLRTLHEWGRAVGISSGGLRNWHRTAGLSGRQGLMFVRVLRAVVKHQTSPAPPEDLLDVVDRRTLVKLLKKSGGTATNLPASIEEFLDRQQFIQNQAAVDVVREALGVPLKSPRRQAS